MACLWYKKKYWQYRLKAEQIIMAERYPQFVLKAKSNGQLFWEGILMSNLQTGYLVNIEYPPNYPYKRPVFWVIHPRIKKGSPHVFIDGSLCVYPKKYYHKQCTAPAGVGLMAGWLLLYEIWLRTGKRW